MRWHSLEEPVIKAEHTNNTYCLVKYKDYCGYDQISDCLYRDGKFINLDSFALAEITKPIAWCSYDEIAAYLDSIEENKWRDPEDKCDYANNLGVILKCCFHDETVTEIPVIILPAVIREENGKRKFYDLTSPEELEIDDVIGWVDTGYIWTILDRGQHD